MNLTRITRLLKLLQMLQAGSGRDAEGLAAECGVSRRTIFRDLETLRVAGVPLEFDGAEDRYFIPSTFFLPPTNFTAEEALALIMLASNLSMGEKLPFTEPARQAALKLESSFPPLLRQEIREATRSIAIDITKVSLIKDKGEYYHLLLKAIARKHVVRMQYASLTEWETISTKLRPYQLLFHNHSWYVIGRSSFHSETRMFNLARIKSLVALKERYTIPPSFSLENFFGNAWRIIPDVGPDQNIVIRFQPLVATNVSEVMWHKTQKLKWLADGSLEFQAQVSGLSEVVWWVLGYGDQAEVLRPAKLRKLVAQRAASMSRIYADA